MTDIQQRLFELRDAEYQKFTAALIPNIAPELIIGVRTPRLRELAKEIYRSGEAEAFMNSLPHEYYEENNLHAFLIEQVKDFDSCIFELERFLPYVDNWAACDSMRPKVFSKHKDELLRRIRRWTGSGHCFAVRYGIGMLMTHFLDEGFSAEILELAAVNSGEYYVKMMVAWFFATALAKQWDAALPYIEQGKLDNWVHNKAIQKAVESRRIKNEDKIYLKTLKKRG